MQDTGSTQTETAAGERGKDMNAKTGFPAQAPDRRTGTRRTGGSRFALTTALGAIGLFLWVLPAAEAQSTRGATSSTGIVQPPLPSGAPLTVAANGPIRLTIGAPAHPPPPAPSPPGHKG